MTLAADPFDKNQRSLSITAHSTIDVDNEKININCSKIKRNIAKTVNFNDLNLIGVIQYTDYLEALFISESQDIFNVRVGETIGKELFVLDSITLSEIQLQIWKGDECGNKELLIVKL